MFKNRICFRIYMVSDNPRISVIVPAHNEEHYIAKTIDSFTRQRTPYELIVVANGCTDKTAQISDDLGAKVIELETASIPLAKNKGVSQAGGNILVFNDADTIVAPNYLESIMASLQNYDYGSARAKAENWKLGTLAYTAMLNFGGLVFRESCGNMFVRRDVFESIHGFDEKFMQGEDSDLSIRLRRTGHTFTFLLGTYTIPSARAVSLSRTVRDSISYLKLLATGNSKE